MKILFLTHRLPYAANRGDRIRALHMLRLLASQAEVHLLSLVHDEDEARHAADLKDLAATVTIAPVSRLIGYGRALAAIPTDRSFTHSILHSSTVEGACRDLAAKHRPDVVLSYCSGMARFALDPPLSDIPMVLDMVDVDSEKWRMLGRTSRVPARWVYAMEAGRMSAFEARAARQARAVLVVNERERASLLQIEPGANVHVVPNGIALDEFYASGAPSLEPRVTFCGVMNYRPNEEAAVWFAEKVWPAVRAVRPEAQLTLVGSNPTNIVRRLAAVDRSIEVTGAVPDVRPYLWRSAVGIAPLFVARGVQNKVLEAVAAGLPTVITPAVADGLPSDVRPACVVAGDVDTFAAAVLDLLDRAPAERRAMAESADLGSLGWRERLSQLLPILEDARHSRCSSTEHSEASVA